MSRTRLAGFGDEGRRPQAKDARGSRKLKGKEMDSRATLEPPEENIALLTP